MTAGFLVRKFSLDLIRQKGQSFGENYKENHIVIILKTTDLARHF
jgi:hypothetical protein